jgi:hypothetical protein
MTSNASTRKASFVDRSPLVFAVTLVVFLLSLWHAPISLPYLLLAAGLGVLLGCGFLFTYAKPYGDFMLAVCPLFLIIAQISARYMFFSSAEREAAPWSEALQFVGLAYVIIFGFAWLFRNRLVSSLPSGDVEQIVGRERRGRVS